MAKIYVEKEVKFKVDDVDTISAKLKRSGAKFLGGAFQRTVRFDTGDMSLEKRGVFFKS